MDDLTDGRVPSSVLRPPKPKTRYTSATTEADLIMRITAGDQEAWNMLQQREAAKALQYARHLARNEEDAEDIVAEAFERAYRSIHTFRGEASFCTWLFRIITRLYIDFQKGGNRQAQMMVPLTERMENSATAQSDPRTSDPATILDYTEWRKEVRAAVHAAIEALPADYRKAILLRYEEDLSYQEIAEVTEWSESTVTNKLFRARRRLAEILSHFNESEGC